jgi:hypothetical protein
MKFSNFFLLSLFLVGGCTTATQSVPIPTVEAKPTPSVFYPETPSVVTPCDQIQNSSYEEGVKDSNFYSNLDYLESSGIAVMHQGTFKAKDIYMSCSYSESDLKVIEIVITVEGDKFQIIQSSAEMDKKLKLLSYATRITKLLSEKDDPVLFKKLTKIFSHYKA